MNVAALIVISLSLVCFTNVARADSTPAQQSVATRSTSKPRNRRNGAVASRRLQQELLPSCVRDATLSPEFSRFFVDGVFTKPFRANVAAQTDDPLPVLGGAVGIRLPAGMSSRDQKD